MLIALALVVFVQCNNVYPQLLLARLLFSLGGAAASTMVTAVLPAMSSAVNADHDNDGVNSHVQEQHVDHRPSAGGSANEEGSTHAPSLSVSSELTVTPATYQSQSTEATETEVTATSHLVDPTAATSKIAGYVGMFAGCGALLALILFLPLPERFQKHGYSPESSLQYSYYIVASVALLVSVWCLIGLHGLHEEGVKSTSIFKSFQGSRSTKNRGTSSPTYLWQNFQTAILVGFRHADIGLGYVGGFVARASSVGISLFVPLLVNALFRSSGICGNEQGGQIGDLPDMKRKCSQAYILAAELTGVSQLVALLCAPIFGYASARLGKRQVPLMFASVSGIVGYILLATRFAIDSGHQNGNAEAILSMCLIGISQIGAIVCSLGVLSGGVLKQQKHEVSQDAMSRDPQSHINDQESQAQSGEGSPLIPKAGTNTSKDLSRLKGSIAGVYSLYGGAGILILTKLGGLLFDRVSFAAPFYIMAMFNGILLLTCILVTTSSLLRSKGAN